MLFYNKNVSNSTSTLKEKTDFNYNNISSIIVPKQYKSN